MINIQFVLYLDYLLDKSYFIPSFDNSSLGLYYSDKLFSEVNLPDNANKVPADWDYLGDNCDEVPVGWCWSPR